ncbi:MAG: glucose 1-dehydrogenase [Rhodospirillaceae bacterium]|jgi:NAD(P)-dependent dehydrogenase (short-subunit alcohol dehydrogenase family)|nr:glucose 1-dehydrogenase [Rhodospirillaceae bacterium]MBT4772350.1 glucose 1-dehydrogenase [Rhodospirillaceae bacterium]MBT5359672.1 glucose 1-dehydrogenase [Rhodospirillaceae bacterium]MBT5769900.1 glucose 1-dehydrogenase [Rhodospirillaceae bacterium]MBT6309834.1 glucose 1-dehydrogenase [Rhodospirillaceae bacterium]
MSNDARPVALVTGASYGLGAAIAEKLAGDGFDVAVTELDPADLSGTLAAIEAGGGQSLGVALDLQSDNSIAAAASAVLDHFGRIDLLVNNAAMLLAKPALDVAAAEFEAVMRINVTGTYMMTQHVARHLIEEGRPGQIINIASTFTTVGAVNVSPYGISKAAIGGMTRHLAAEWAPHDIRVNAVAPGTSMTKLRAEIFDNDQTRRDAGLSKIPLGRFTEPEDIAGAVSYLASPAAAYVTGHVLAVDGGMTVT